MPSHKALGPHSCLVSLNFQQRQRLEDPGPGLGLGKVITARKYLGECCTLVVGCIWEMSCTDKHGIKYPKRDFPDGPVVKNPPSNAGDAGSISGWGTKPTCRNY